MMIGVMWTEPENDTPRRLIAVFCETERTGKVEFNPEEVRELWLCLTRQVFGNLQ